MAGSRRDAGIDRSAPEDVVEALQTFVNTRIMARGRAVRPDDALEAAGIDSMAFLKILLFIETRFGFWMPDEDLTEDNLVSIRALAAYIGRRARS